LTQQKLQKNKRGWLSYILVAIIIVAYFGGWFGAVYALNTQRPLTIVDGNSMFPTLKDGDIVLLRGIPAEQLAEDFENGKPQIIVFHSSSPPKHKIFFLPAGKPIIHRIHDVVYDSNGQLAGFVTKGDNNRTTDPGITTPDRIVGTVIAGPIPYVGSVLLFLQSPYGISLLVVAIVLLLAWSILSEVNKRKSEDQKT
jgi:signal peptidase I